MSSPGTSSSTEPDFDGLDDPRLSFARGRAVGRGPAAGTAGRKPGDVRPPGLEEGAQVVAGLADGRVVLVEDLTVVED